MTLQQFLLILRAHWLAVAVTLGVVVGGTVAFSLLWTKKYTATTTIVLDFKGTDPVLGVMLPAQMLPGYLATQIEIIKSHKVAMGAVRILRFAESPDAKQQWIEATAGRGSIEDWLADVLRRDLDADPSRETSLVDINYTSASPQFSAVVANAFADAYQAVNLELRVEPAKQTATWFGEQLRTLRTNLETAQANLAQYQREKGIHASDERFDVESAKLNELSAQLTQAQTTTFDALSRQRQLKEFLARGADPASLPDILANSLIQGMKSQLTQSEAKLDQVSSQLGANHPEVQRLNADIAAQRAKIRSEVETVAASINNTASIAQRREAELRTAVAEQKSKLLRANQGRDEITVMLKEVEAAQRAYETASQRYAQTNLESQTTQTNIAVLNRAIAPLQSSWPKPVLFTVISIGVGGFLAVGLALLLELFDRRVRSESDILDAFDFPLLGILEKARARRPRRFSLLPRLGPVNAAAG